MRLTDGQLRDYIEQGFLLVPDCFSAAEVDVLRKEYRVMSEQRTPDRVLETDGHTVRALHGCHDRSDLFRRFVRLPRLIEPARQILETEVYIHQFKINAKATFRGDVWPWHQDFVFWHQDDGMQAPRVVNAALFLNDVTEFNSPLILIPRSHLHGMLENSAEGAPRTKRDSSWLSNVSASLKYTLGARTVSELADAGGLVSPKGRPGSVLLFHSNIAHASGPNISPYERVFIIVSYNSVQNTPVQVANPRPEFLVSRNYTPLDMAAQDSLA